MATEKERLESVKQAEEAKKAADQKYADEQKALADERAAAGIHRDYTADANKEAEAFRAAEQKHQEELKLKARTDAANAAFNADEVLAERAKAAAELGPGASAKDIDAKIAADKKATAEVTKEYKDEVAKGERGRNAAFEADLAEESLGDKELSKGKSAKEKVKEKWDEVTHPKK